jgi:hypothetical protein
VDRCQLAYTANAKGIAAQSSPYYAFRHRTMSGEWMPKTFNFVHQAPLRRTSMKVVAQDPSVKANGRIMTAAVRVPAEHLEPGPRSHRFHVVDYDASTSTLHPPGADPVREGAEPLELSDDELLGDFAFHAHNSYAIAARTLATFESALGRRLPWSFGSHQLYLVPHAFAEANAYYAGDDHAIYFGYFPDLEGRPVYTCLSHDVIAHETTHAILDGLRPRFVEPGLPDQAAFHEAFADIVALLSVFSIREVLEPLLGDADPIGRIPAGDVSEQTLKSSVLFKLAEQMGEATSGERGSALRRSVRLQPSEDWRSDLTYEEPHRRGEVLVAAMMQTLLEMWTKRLDALIFGGGLDRARAAEEGAKSADHLLRMAVRAIDYSPPVEFEFEDFIDAMLMADAVVAPDDEHGYRTALGDAFAGFGIRPPEHRIVDLMKVSHPAAYDNLNFAALGTDPDEVFRFIWQNSDFLELDRAHHARVQSVRPSVRVGPDGLVIRETVADYVQSLDATAGELESQGLSRPDGLDPSTKIQVWGGGVVVFDQFGQAKLHQTKPLQDWQRQSRRLDYLVHNGLRDTRRRIGFSLGTPLGQRFAEFHTPDDRAGERW